MNAFFKAILIACALTSVSACGLKGKLKSPTQAEADAVKKAQKREKSALRAERVKANEAKRAEELTQGDDTQAPEVNPTEPPPSSVSVQ